MSTSSEYDEILADFKRMIAEGEQLQADGQAGIRSIEKLIARKAGLAGAASGLATALADFSTSMTGAENYRTITDRVLGFLNAHRGQAFRIAEIRAAVNCPHMYAISANLSRLTQERRVTRSGRGLYRAGIGPPSTVEERRSWRLARAAVAADGSPALPTSTNGNGRGHAAKAPQGTWTAAVLAACNGIDGHITVRRVMEQMTASGFEWKIKSPRITVTKTLNRLVRDSKLEMVELGTGGAQSKYRRLSAN